MLLFFIGIVEMLIIAAWTKMVVSERVLISGAISFINILVWYYVLETVVNNINNMNIVLFYAAGCATGTMLSGIISAFLKRETQASQAEEHETAYVSG